MRLIEFYAELRHEKELAYLFFDGANEIWIPKSQIKHMEQAGDKDFEIHIPEWLAIKKEII